MFGRVLARILVSACAVVGIRLPIPGSVSATRSFRGFLRWWVLVDRNRQPAAGKEQ